MEEILRIIDNLRAARDDARDLKLTSLASDIDEVVKKALETYNVLEPDYEEED